MAIQTIRSQKVILDADLARIYRIPVLRFNQAVKRNADRFPEDFRFRLTKDEWEAAQRLRSQIVILKTGRGRHRKYLPYAFTEHGAIMAANVLNSPRAVQMSVFVVRAFLKMRELLGGTRGLARQLRELEAKLTTRLDVHEAAIVDVLQRLMRLLDPPPATAGTGAAATANRIPLPTSTRGLRPRKREQMMNRSSALISADEDSPAKHSPA